MNVKRLFISAAGLIIATGLWSCESPDGDAPQNASQAESTHSADAGAHGAGGSAASDVGGSYNKDGVAPFGMTSRKPVPVAEAPVATEAVAAGNALLADQNATFGTHCQSCHGADGKGIEPLGVTLVGSSFIKSKSQDELVAMLKAGRLPGDPDSVKQRVMPGFAWMNDEQLGELAEFLKAQNQ